MIKTATSLLESMDETKVFTIYSGQGTPLAHIISGDLTEEQMTKLMEIFNGADSAENWIVWKEVL